MTYQPAVKHAAYWASEGFCGSDIALPNYSNSTILLIVLSFVLL